MASSIWHTEGEFWVPKYQIYFGGVMNTPAYVVFGEKKKKGFDSFFTQSARKKKKTMLLLNRKIMWIH